MEIREGYKQTEVGVIPEDWRDADLVEICFMKSGEGITSTNIDQFSKYPCYGGNGLRGFTTRFTHNGCYALIGRQGALCGNVLVVDGQFFASEHAIVVTAFERTNIIWLALVLGEMKLNQYSESSAQPGLSVSKLLGLKIAVPTTRAEQEAIAGALSDADALISSLENLIAKKLHIKQGAMQQLLRPKDEWVEETVSDFGEIITGGTPATGIKEYWGGEVPWVTPTDIKQQKSLSNTDRQITALGLKTIRGIPKNSVLVTCIASIGKNVILARDGACNQQINAVIPNKKHSPNFLYYLFELSKEYLLGHAGITATNIISKKEFSGIEFKTPDFGEQSAIATILSDMDTEITALETKLAKTRQIKQGMMAELLTGRIRLI
jgi:type I restriction enzyme S subunit